MYNNMSNPNALIRAEMEVNPRLKNAIAAHHIIQLLSSVAIIICAAALTTFSGSFEILFWGLGPIYLFIILWIASKCSYQDLRLILVHFNTGLSLLWLGVFSSFCVISLRDYKGIVTVVLASIAGLLCLSSVIFANYGIWKSARKVVLSARLVQRDEYEVLGSHPPTLQSH
ncbi:hypothetical protein ACJMK2_029643 [Sinanodonta woodiana]|uniref:MARVEL domain-containing protein n=1 Tax=Sinanodonta woodiana TaxID=1069815 RepID=A0ABD3XAS8_SINWO